MLVLFIATSAHAQPSPTSQAAIFVGALTFRESQRATANAATVPAFRTLFCKTKTAWASIGNNANCRAPTAGTWTMWYNGQSVGVLLTRSARILSSIASIPHIAVGEERFESWLGTVHDRPLALATQRDVRDTKGWVASRLSDRERTLFLRAFRISVALPHCDGTPHGAMPAAVDGFFDRDVSVIKVIRSSAGQLLVGMAINELLKPCDDVRDPARTTHWFVKRGAESPHFIGNEMYVVDAFDFDNDGRTEWLFSRSRYNEDGFILFFDEFRKSVSSSWHYH